MEFIQTWPTWTLPMGDMNFTTGAAPSWRKDIYKHINVTFIYRYYTSQSHCQIKSLHLYHVSITFLANTMPWKLYILFVFTCMWKRCIFVRYIIYQLYTCISGLYTTVIFKCHELYIYSSAQQEYHTWVHSGSLKIAYHLHKDIKKFFLNLYINVCMLNSYFSSFSV